MELLLGYEILESYKRLSYKEWYALAEFVDNSTQSYRNNREALDNIFKETGQNLRVEISYNNNKPNDFIKIIDNAFGMSLEELKRALILGKKPVNDKERSKYGLGLKTASFWFGDIWTVSTTQLGLNKRYSVTVNLNEILDAEKAHAEQQKELPEEEQTRFIPILKFAEEECDPTDHGTDVTITSLNRKITAAKARKCKNFLRSIFRIDLSSNSLQLFFQDEDLSWNRDEFLNRIRLDRAGQKMFREFELEVGRHTVKGWAGVLKRGSRQDAGFSLLQSDRVIQGWPSSYRPSSLFGEQEGGTNNLVNQRLFGELYLDGFEVSHTKDEILFQEDEEEILDQKLLETLGDYKKAIEDMSIRDEVEEEIRIDYEAITSQIIQNLNSPDFRAAVFQKEVLPIEVLEKTNSEASERIKSTGVTSFDVHIDGLVVTVMISENASPYDPYILVFARAEKDHLTIIINKAHIYYRELNTKETVYEFMKNCIFDGIAEWKAFFRYNTLNPDTIKTIKDHFLRIPMDFPFR